MCQIQRFKSTDKFLEVLSEGGLFKNCTRFLAEANTVKIGRSFQFFAVIALMDLFNGLMCQTFGFCLIFSLGCSESDDNVWIFGESAFKNEIMYFGFVFKG